MSQARHREEMKAYAQYRFAKIGGGYETESESERHSDSFGNRSLTEEVLVGSIPDRSSYSLKTSDRPGLLDVEWRPVCDLLPVGEFQPNANWTTKRRRNRSHFLKQACYEYVDELEFCINLSVLKEKNLSPRKIADAFMRIRKYCTATGRTTIPVFGMEPDLRMTGATVDHSVIIFETPAKTYSECLLRCKTMNCEFFTFKLNGVCSICTGGCFTLKRCGRREVCLGGFFGTENIVRFDKPKFFIFGDDVDMKGDVIHSEIFSERLTVDEWCMKYYFALSVLAGKNKLKRHPKGVNDVDSTLIDLSFNLIGPYAGFKCTKICGQLGSTEYTIRFLLRENELTGTRRFENKGHDKFLPACLDWFHIHRFPYMDFKLNYVCECFAPDSVRSVIADTSKQCRKIKVPGSRDLDLCSDIKLKAFAGHKLKNRNWTHDMYVYRYTIEFMM